MNINVFKAGCIATLCATVLSACTKNLDRLPTNDITSEVVYSTSAGYKQAFAKVYGAYALTGNQGPAGNGDVQGIDEGTSDFLRLHWWAQEISTDEAVVQAGWGDPGIHFFHNMTWSPNNEILTGLYYRSFYQITLANDFIRQAAEDKVASRGISGASADSIKTYKTEARFIRAFQYWVLMDLFGNPAFVTENDVLGASVPKQTTRAELFKYIETELKDIEGSLVAPRQNEYGRADKAAAWALLARMYLNAEVYTGSPRYNDAITYAKKVIDAGYTLVGDYRQLMLADNQLNKNEFILTINYDGQKTQSFGGTTFLTHAPMGGSIPTGSYGVNSGWAGVRTTKNLPGLFPDATGAADKRAQFYTNGQSLELSAEPAPKFEEGYAVLKYKNIKRDGTAGSSLAHSDIDFPLFRLAEMYLIYAEAVLRGGTGGDLGTALGYINQLRTRAYGNTSGNITAADLTTRFILDERARELYWECFRRTDLVRYNFFTTDAYLWPWKGGVSSGTGVASYRNVFPIPTADITANRNLKQNTGY
ncbi:RagB/SusD family nutrient uptake outer membrane protein [Flavisolibacter tropicus]|uniref:Membrane protein n=1 Tax=Flavisolibacter tropicus TaxID=1492898 RepID=A0A172TYN6_9BACT|nr:RagB/SusD family nutrient uptake outer membrane protein [Flavisolibacter tropicus]ANE52078.1 membrane protein [Flavisolibacter tropicus]